MEKPNFSGIYDYYVSNKSKMTQYTLYQIWLSEQILEESKKQTKLLNDIYLDIGIC